MSRETKARKGEVSLARRQPGEDQESLLLASALALLAATPASAQEKFRVITTFTVIADMAQNVAGDAAEDQLRPLRAFDIAGRGLVIMDLRARFSNGAHVGGVAGHVLRHIGDNREGAGGAADPQQWA